MKRVTWFVLFLVMGVSCLDQPDCYRQNLNLIGISFKKLYDGKADTVILYGVSSEGKADTVGTSSISVLLNYLKTSMTIEIKGLEKDHILDLGYDSKAQFVSQECGTRFIVSGLQILNKKLSNSDSVRVASALPSNPAGTNIVIYRCPRTNMMRFSFRQLLLKDDSIGQDYPRVVKTIAINSEAPVKYSPTPKYSLAATKSVLLPLDATANQIAYHFQFDNEISSVSFKYKKGSKEIIKYCGTQDVFGRLDTISTDFKRLKVVKDTIVDPPQTNVIAYRCPISNEIGIVVREKKGDSKPASIKITSISADYPDADLSMYVGKTVSNLVLPLNPSPSSTNTSTTFTFVIRGETKVLTLNYDAQDKLFSNGCGYTTVFTALKASQQSTGIGFTAQTILDDKVKFPSVNNVEIIP